MLELFSWHTRFFICLFSSRDRLLSVRKKDQIKFTDRCELASYFCMRYLKSHQNAFSLESQKWTESKPPNQFKDGCCFFLSVKLELKIFWLLWTWTGTKSWNCSLIRQEICFLRGHWASPVPWCIGHRPSSELRLCCWKRLGFLWHCSSPILPIYPLSYIESKFISFFAKLMGGFWKNKQSKKTCCQVGERILKKGKLEEWAEEESELNLKGGQQVAFSSFKWINNHSNIAEGLCA